MGLMKYLSSGGVMLVALILGAMGFGFTMALIGFDTTVEIGFTLGAFIFGIIVAIIYTFLQSKFGSKLPK